MRNLPLLKSSQAMCTSFPCCRPCVSHSRQHTHFEQERVCKPPEEATTNITELYRVPAYYRRLRVTMGKAYLTQAGQDHILQPGDEMDLARGPDAALVSALGCEQVVIELFKLQKKSKNGYDWVAISNDSLYHKDRTK